MIKDELLESLRDLRNIEPNPFETFWWMMFVMIVGFIVGFMVGVSY